MAVSAAAAEYERRRMTQAVAEQGSRGYTTQEQTVKPSADLATAATASIAAAPVDLSTGQSAQLAAGTDALAARANAYADAQRQIFKTGQESTLVSENAAYDKFQTIADASNFKLDKYKEQLAEQEAYRNSLGSGGGPSYWEDGFNQFVESQDAAVSDGRVFEIQAEIERLNESRGNIRSIAEGQQFAQRKAELEAELEAELAGVGYVEQDVEADLGPMYGMNMETLWPHASLLLDDLERKNYEISVENFPGAAEQMNADVDNMFRGALRSGAGFQESIDQLKALLTDEYGPYNLPEEYAIALITPWIYRWESAFLNRSPDSINPELRYARDVDNPDWSPTAVTQGSDGRPSSFSPRPSYYPSDPSNSSRRGGSDPAVIPDWDKWRTEDPLGSTENPLG